MHGKLPNGGGGKREEHGILLKHDDVLVPHIDRGKVRYCGDLASHVPQARRLAYGTTDGERDWRQREKRIGDQSLLITCWSWFGGLVD